MFFSEKKRKHLRFIRQHVFVRLSSFTILILFIFFNFCCILFKLLPFRVQSLYTIQPYLKDPYKVKQRQAMFGKNIIITDNMDWTTGAIIEASLDRWQVEDRFRLSKNEQLVGVQPIRRLETPSKTQAEVLSAFGYQIDESGVLQPTE